MVWLERRAGEEELTSVEAWGDLTRMRRQLEGKEEVTEQEWKEAREMVVDTTKGEHQTTYGPSAGIISSGGGLHELDELDELGRRGMPGRGGVGRAWPSWRTRLTCCVPSPLRPKAGTAERLYEDLSSPFSLLCVSLHLGR